MNHVWVVVLALWGACAVFNAVLFWRATRRPKLRIVR